MLFWPRRSAVRALPVGRRKGCGRVKRHPGAMCAIPRSVCRMNDRPRIPNTEPGLQEAQGNGCDVSASATVRGDQFEFVLMAPEDPRGAGSSEPRCMPRVRGHRVILVHLWRLSRAPIRQLCAIATPARIVKKSIDLQASSPPLALQAITYGEEFVFEVGWHRPQAVQLVFERGRAPIERPVPLLDLPAAAERDDLGNQHICHRGKHRQPIRHDVSDRIIAWPTGCHQRRLPGEDASRKSPAAPDRQIRATRVRGHSRSAEGTRRPAIPARSERQPTDHRGGALRRRHPWSTSRLVERPPVQ